MSREVGKNGGRWGFSDRSRGRQGGVRGWRAVGLAILAAMTNAGDAFAFPFRDPQWANKLLIQGLINLIPIVGQIATWGWGLETLDNIRQGRQELAPYGFHLGRGIQFVIPALVWVLVVGIPAGIVIGLINLVTGGNTSGGNALTSLIRLIIAVVGGFFAPALYVNVSRNGMAGGFQIGEIFDLSFRNIGVTIGAGVLFIVGALIGELGWVLCCVGVIFTGPYAGAILAGVASWFEGQLGLGPAGSPAYSPGGGYGPGGYGPGGYGPGGYPQPPAHSPYGGPSDGGYQPPQPPPPQSPQEGPYGPPQPPPGGGYRPPQPPPPEDEAEDGGYRPPPPPPPPTR